MACNGVLSTGTRLVVNDWITPLGMSVVDVIVLLVNFMALLVRFHFNSVIIGSNRGVQESGTGSRLTPS